METTLNRKQKIDFLKAAIKGEASLFDLIAQDCFYVKAGSTYVVGGRTFSENEFQRIKEVWDRQGKKPQAFLINSSLVEQFVMRHTKPYFNDQKS